MSVAISAGAGRVAQLLRDSERAVVLTGAGVSVPSGIPDFRSPRTGLWENVDPMEVAHIDAWRRDPDRFWHFYGDRFASLVDKRPNDAHRALAELERRGRIKAVITQNIDRLHRVAGTQRLIEVHGSIECSVCVDCGGRFTLERVTEQLRAHDGAPECPCCFTPLKPDVTLFGEMLPERALSEAQALALDADLMICVGLLARGLSGGGAAGDHARGRRAAGADHAGPDSLRRRRRRQARRRRGGGAALGARGALIA